MNEDKQFIDRINRALDDQVEGQAPSALGRLRAARREALDAASRPAPHRHWIPAIAASFFVVLATTAIWFEVGRGPDDALGSLLQTASITDQQLLDEGDDIELYRDLEFYFWLEQEQKHAG